MMYCSAAYAYYTIGKSNKGQLLLFEITKTCWDNKRTVLSRNEYKCVNGNWECDLEVIEIRFTLKIFLTISLKSTDQSNKSRNRKRSYNEF